MAKPKRRTASEIAMDTMATLDELQTPHESPPPRGPQTEDVPGDWAHLEPE